MLIQILKNRFTCIKFLIFLGNMQNEHEQVDFEKAISLTGEYFLNKILSSTILQQCSIYSCCFLNDLKCFQILKTEL